MVAVFNSGTLALEPVMGVNPGSCFLFPFFFKLGTQPFFVIAYVPGEEKAVASGMTHSQYAIWVTTNFPSQGFLRYPFIDHFEERVNSWVGYAPSSGIKPNPADE